MQQAQVNRAHRLFLDLGSDSVLPHHTSMTYFRERVGAEALQKIFHGVLGQARELGLVKDRLRLKDATPVIANIAIPSTMRLVAEMREQVLDAAQPFAPERVAAEWQHADALGGRSEDLPDTERLVLRVQHLRSVLLWADELPAAAAFRAGAAAHQQQLQAALTWIAHFEPRMTRITRINQRQASARR
jgi:hypothetical protein